MKSIYAGCLLFGVNISRAENLDIKSQTHAKKMPSKSSLCDEIEILFLGTGAADWPSDKYPSDVNELLRGDYRGLSSALINKKILIDCGPTVPLALEKFNVDVNLITDIVITHTHRDHFSLETLDQLLKKRSANEKINIWLDEGAVFKTEKLSGYNVHPLTAICAGF
jgi:ribonuclease BN (tRNA processing enzyme)